MLRSLDIHNVLIIEELSLELGSGLNVLTGETGAGKSIVLDALGLVLGWRSRADLVRPGVDKGKVTAVFELSKEHSARHILEEAGIETPDDMLILRRVNTRDGRKTAWANDQRVSGDILRRLSDKLVELLGQNEKHGLLNAHQHRFFLDDYGGIDTSSCRSTWVELRRCRQALVEIEHILKKAKNEEDFLRFSLDELDALAPQPGEESALDIQRRDLQAAEKIQNDVMRALQMIGSEGAEVPLCEAMRWLEGASGKLNDSVGDAKNLLEHSIDALSRTLVELSDAQERISECSSYLNSDPIELETVEERLFAIRALARKHNVLPDDLGQYADELRLRLQAIEHREGDIQRLQADIAKAEVAYEAEALRLSSARREAAKQLDLAVLSELAPLKMERAVFETHIARAEPGPEGTDEIFFKASTNPGAPAAPLNRVASGGELSRFLLALKVCLVGKTDIAGSSGLTMIFDEIDQGVGGATADAVGRRLKALSKASQILVVTHSPQVAALGDFHWRVEKRIRSGKTLSSIKSLSVSERVEEIARMLSGDKITDTARAAAKTLLEAS